VESTLNAKELLPDQASLTLRNVKVDNCNWMIKAGASREAAHCPDCGVLSKARHSSYERRLKDLPIQGQLVELTVRVGRWRCRNRDCPRRVFCQRLPETAPTHARQTKRFGEVGHAIAHALGGRAGERLSRRLGIPVGRNALLRRVKRWAQSRLPAGPIPVIGVDEWAWRKGQNYGTILVDLERGVVADLLPDRSAASFEKWLQEHPEVQIVSRDRDGVYAEGGYSGAPRAQQVADRFHLVQGLIRAVQDELAHQRGGLRMPTQEIVGHNSQGEATIAVLEPEVMPMPQRGAPPSPRPQKIRQERWERKQELFAMVKDLQAQGIRAFEIVKLTELSRGTVDRWLRLSECPPLRSKKAPRPGMVEYLSEELRCLWDQGCQNGRELLEAIRELGYVGSYSSLTQFLQPWREEKRAAERLGAPQPPHRIHSAVSAVRQISAQEAASALSKPRPILNERQSKIVDFLKRTPDFATMRHLLLSFRSILCNGKVSSLARWIQEAEATGIAAIGKYVRQLKRDRKAVEHAVEYQWSNGPVEGHINRLKTIKRQMYGRAGFELLRSRVLPMAA
jgi:transposase